MADNQEGTQQQAASAGTSKTEGASTSGDPGRTPGKAEGDEETVDDSLEQKGNQ